MEMDIEQLKEEVQKFFGDTCRSRMETLDGLEELSSLIEMLIETLEGDA